MTFLRVSKKHRKQRLQTAMLALGGFLENVGRKKKSTGMSLSEPGHTEVMVGNKV